MAPTTAACFDALRSGAFPLRGIAVVDPDVSDAELDDMHRAGVRGIRINVASVTAGLRFDDAPRLAARIRELGWHLQFFVDAGATPDLFERLAALPVRCVIDHFGHLNAEDGIGSPAAQALLRLASLDHVWFKLSGGYRVSREQPPYPSVTPFARALVERAAERCVWGTDWPHPVVERMDNDGDIADALAAWIDDESIRTRVLADNPARLYDFPASC
jgi:predicted TIM-barrel fold metal-dependent hydrolase